MHSITFWFVLGICFVAAGLGMFLWDVFAPGNFDFNYTGPFVTGASMFALHVLEVNTRARRVERREEQSQQIVSEIVQLAKDVKANITTLEISGMNLRYRNAVSSISFIKRLGADPRLTDFDAERCEFYIGRLKEDLRAFLQTLHPCFFYGDIYVEAMGTDYDPRDFERQDGFVDNENSPELAKCEIELEGLMSGTRLTGFEFLYFSNGENLNEFVEASGSLKTYCDSFRSVWLAEQD